MFRRILCGVLSATLMAVAAPLWAQGTDLPPAQLNALKKKLAQRMPALPAIQSARTTPIQGVIELRVDDSVLYTDINGDTVIDGHLIDSATGRDLTEARKSEITQELLRDLPLKDAFAWKNGNGKRRLVVFADPNCGYCKRFEAELQKLKDVTVYTFPIAILGPDSTTKAENIWCMRDRTAAWLGWMLKGVQPTRALGKCETPLERNLALSQKLGVQGTPTMFFADGSKLPSAASAAEVEKRLQAAAAKAPAR